ncbi:MAG: sulfatase [bacterium]|nr:hypothetical protein [Planctomycetota bacterium]HIL51504.1 hypothetical protein [Planctomycetota bacterium]
MQGPHTRVVAVRTSALALLVLASASSSCSSDKAPAHGGDLAPATLQHLELRPLQFSAAATDTAPTEVERLVPTGDRALWSGEGQRVFQAQVAVSPAESDLPGFVTNAEGLQAPALVVVNDAGEARRVKLAGQFDPQKFNRVTVRLAVPEEEELTVTCLSQGQTRAQSAAISVAGSPQPQLVVFDLASLRKLEAPLDELSIEGAGHASGMLVLEVSLSLSPLTSFLRPTSLAPALIGLSSANLDTRRGVGLFSNAPAEVIFEASQRHSLVFCYAVPEALRLPGSEARLVVKIESEVGASIERSLELASVRTAWKSAAIPLAELGPGTKRALFELHGAHSAIEACAISELRVFEPAAQPRTVVLITSDTHRGDHIGALGPDAPVRTPAIDSLAARGVLFSDAYAASNTTNPSHASLLTGVHVRDTRVLDNRSPLVDKAICLAEAFSAAGYHTMASVSVRHLLDDESGFGQGFDRMSGPVGPDRTARATTVECIEWLEELRDEPVFLWLHLFDAHSPYEPPAFSDRRYYTKRRDPFDSSKRLDYKGKFLPLYLRGLTDIDFPYAQYRAEIDALDHELGRVLRHPRLASAVVALTADHGESFGAHGIYWDHAGLHPDTLHIPLILSWPGGPLGARCDTPVRQMDLGRTLLSLAGEVNPEFAGSDLRAALAGTSTPRARFSIAKEGNAAAILSDGWFLNINLRDHQSTAMVNERQRHAIELYDLASDPQAAHDKSGTEAARAARLRSELIAWLAGSAPRSLSRAGQVSMEQGRRLAGLGYTGEGASDSAIGGDWFDEDCDCSRCGKF